MTNLIIKGNRYRLVDNKSFELPLPLSYTVLKEDNEIAKYDIAADESVHYTILTKYKEQMITPINRPYTISDIYYFFSSRVFQDKTPFTGYELSRVGLCKYNVFEIVRRTRGITPYDTYWIRFEGDNCDYETARKDWEALMSAEHYSRADIPQPSAVYVPTNTARKDEAVTAEVDEILRQQKVDVEAAIAEHSAPAAVEEAPKNSTMSTDEIEQLLAQAGLSDSIKEEPSEQEQKSKTVSEPSAAPSPQPSQDPAPTGGNLSAEDIEKLFAATTQEAPQSATVQDSGSDSHSDSHPDSEAKPASEPTGGNLSAEDIEKLFAATTQEAPQSAPVQDSGSDSDSDSHPDSEAKPASEPSGGNLSAEDIEKLFAATTQEAPQSAPVQGSGSDSDSDSHPNSEAKPASEPIGGNLSAEDIEKLFADSAAESAEEAPPSGDLDEGNRLSAEEIEALLGDMKKDAQT